MNIHYLRKIRKKYKYFYANDGDLIVFNDSVKRAFVSPFEFLCYYIQVTPLFMKDRRFSKKLNRVYNRLKEKGQVALPKIKPDKDDTIQ